MNNWTIRKRIVIGFATVLALVAGLAITSTVLLGRIRAESNYLDTDALPGLEAMSKIKGSATEIQIKVLRTMLAKSADDRKKFEGEIDGLKGDIKKQMDDYESTIHLAEDREMFTALQKSRDTYIANRNHLFELVNAGKEDDAIAYNISALRPAFEAYRASVEKMFQWNLDSVNNSSGRSRSFALQAGTVTITLSIIVVLLGATLATVIVIGLNKVLSRVALSLGDGSTQIVSAATQVSSSSQSLAEGASEQAAYRRIDRRAFEHYQAKHGKRTEGERIFPSGTCGCRHRRSRHAGDESGHGSYQGFQRRHCQNHQNDR
jgi:methyl-accepting chemotaxis protein